MNVSFLTPSVSRALGGIYEVERNLGKALDRSTPVSVEVVGLEDERTEEDLSEWRPLQPTVHPVSGPAAFGYSPGLVDTLVDLGPDLVHLHSLWMYTSVATLRWKWRTNRPHIITVHGMLDPWAVQNARWKKQLAGWLYEQANLRRAACLHVFSEAEYEAVRDYGLDTPVCVIPNGVQLPDETVAAEAPWAEEIGPEKNVLLFLGRIHPKKGLVELLEAWKRVQEAGGAHTGEWALAVVGWDDGGHENELRRMVEREAIGDVHFLGPMFGTEKEAAFSHAEAFVLPSHSEGLPMAVLEAWSYRLPVMMTSACNLPVGFDKEAAVRVEPSPTSIGDGMHTLFEQSEAERRDMGRRGRALVEKQFTWEQVARQMTEVYRWVLGKGEPPSTVVFD